MDVVSLVVIIGGLMIGSFLNVVIFRLPRQESLVRPGSHCPACAHMLRVSDLIPVISYLVLGGKCRYCRAKISFRYLLVEIITAGAFYWLYLKGGVSVWTGAAWLLTGILMAAAFIDLDCGLIPNRLTYPGIISGLLLSYFTIGVPNALLGILLFGGVYFLAALLSGGGMGGGDVKLAAVIGVYCGWQGAVVAFILTSLGGGLWALGLLLLGRANRKTPIRLGPFLAMGGWAAYVYAPELLAVYFNLVR